MFESAVEADLLCVTTNSTLNGDELVMGAGAARQLKAKVPKPTLSPRRAGAAVREKAGHLQTYGLLEPKAGIGLFQTKTHWSEDSPLQLVGKSAMQLLKWTARRPRQTVFLNYPGIGHGGLSKEEVRPIISELPDTVHVWTRK